MYHATVTGKHEVIITFVLYCPPMFRSLMELLMMKQSEYLWNSHDLSLQSNVLFHMYTVEASYYRNLENIRVENVIHFVLKTFRRSGWATKNF